MFAQVMEHVKPYLNQRQFLKCRLVCEGWRVLVDEILEKARFPKKTENTFGSRKKIMTLPKNNRFSSYNGLEDYNVKLGGDHKFTSLCNDILNINDRSPFIANGIVIKPSEHADDAYWENLYGVLDKFGKDIWECEIYMGFKNPEGAVTEEDDDETKKAKVVQFCRDFRRLLTRLPNLKHLDLHNMPGLDQGRKLLGDQVRNEILLVFGNERFPQLPHLVKLNVDFNEREIPVVFLHLFPTQFWNNLHKLEVADHQFESICNAVGDHKVATLFPNLKILFMFKGSNWESSKLKLLRCPLEQLVILSHFAQKNDLAGLIPIFNNFGQTLQHLRVHWLPNVEDMTMNARGPNTASSLYLENCLQFSAPRVKHVTLVNPFESLNFLVCLESLEYLEIQYLCSKPSNPFVSVKSDDILEIHGFTQDMYVSNIWNKMPFLKEIKLEFPDYRARNTVVYTRTGYKTFMQEL